MEQKIEGDRFPKKKSFFNIAVYVTDGCLHF